MNLSISIATTRSPNSAEKIDEAALLGHRPPDNCIPQDPNSCAHLSG